MSATATQRQGSAKVPPTLAVVDSLLERGHSFAVCYCGHRVFYDCDVCGYATQSVREHRARLTALDRERVERAKREEKRRRAYWRVEDYRRRGRARRR